MTTVVEKVFSTVMFDEPQSHENMVVIPLISTSVDDGEVHTNLITLEEALNQDLVDIQEIEGGGAVPTLTVINRSPTLILITDGETAKGGQQDREFSTSILIPGKKGETPVEIEVPVNCIERSRWSGGMKHSGSGKSSYGTLRALRTKYMQGTAFSMEEYKTPQGEIWESIEKKHAAFATSSDTRSLYDAYDEVEKTLSESGEKFKLLPKQVGMIIVINGEVAGMDYYGMHDFLKSNWNKLLEGYALDAFEEIAKESAKICTIEEAIKKAQEFIDQLKNAKIKIIKNPRKTAGDDHRIDSEEVTGQALVTEEKVLHMAAFSRSTWEKDEAKGFLPRTLERQSRRIQPSE
jgi:hypothetical protein